MAHIDLQYLSPDDLAVASETRKRSDSTAVENIRAGALSLLNGLDDVQITVTDLEQGVIRFVCRDIDIGRVQAAIAKRAKNMVPRGHMVASHLKPSILNGEGI